MKAHKVFILILGLLVFLPFFTNSCDNKPINYLIHVRFMDSTYSKEVLEYKIGDRIYVLAGELTLTKIPDAVKIYLNSSIMDEETIIGTWPPGVDTDGLTSVHVGDIITYGTTEFKINNEILEVDPTGDIIIARYIVKGNIAVDTAFIKP